MKKAALLVFSLFAIFLVNAQTTKTVGSGANYTTLKLAFDAINAGSLQGEIILQITGSTTETVAAELNASGTGSANYTSITIYPTTLGLSVSGTMSGPLIDLIGADNVTIDGRVNATGTTKDLSIISTSTASSTGTSAIRFIEGASNNSIKYCTIKSSETLSSSGILFFSTTSTDSGNNNNVIENNNITNAADANRPVNAIYSYGTSGKENSGNIIRNNNIYDFFKHYSASRGIYLYSNTTSWTIEGNSFYETTAFIPTGTVTYDVIKISNTSGDGFIVSDNYIGGSGPQCAGTWTKTNNDRNLFNAIYLKVGTAVASSVQNNTIKNFDWSNSGSSPWTGINILAGAVDIGTITGNCIGASTGTNSIKVTGGSNGQSIYGIDIENYSEINCKNNTIGSITGVTTSTYSTHIYCINVDGSATITIEDNSIGSTTEPNSISASSASTDNQQKVYCIYSKNAATTLIRGNTIANVTNNTSNAAVGTRGFVYGMNITNGANTIDQNTIYNLSIANANTSTSDASIVGIRVKTDTQAQVISENTIYNLSNTYSLFEGAVVGVYLQNATGASAGEMDANFIHSLSVANAATNNEIYGILMDTDGVVYSNNIIFLGGSTDTEIFGIYDSGNTGKANSLFFNTINISGTPTGSEKSYAVRYNTANSTRDLRNNILFNARSGGTGGHYAIYYDNTGGVFTADYNDYYINGTGGVLAYYGGNKTTLDDIQTATSQNANSLNSDPGFSSAGGTSADDYVTSAVLPAVFGTGVLTDYNGVVRADPPKMGALESSLGYIWQGSTDTDFGTASNWESNSVPQEGANISFALTPANDCHLDQNRIVNDITNTSTNSKQLVLNGYELTIKGEIVLATAEQIDATASSSVLVFEGTAAQEIPSGVFKNNTVEALTVDNSAGLTQNGNLIVPTAFSLTSGDFVIGANTLTLNGTITTTTGTLTGGATSNIVIGGSGASATLPSVALNNLTLNRSNGLVFGGDVSVAGTLVLTAGTVTVGANTLTISGSSPTCASGTIDASNASATVAFTNSSAITLAASLFTGDINNLTINGEGVTASSDLTINGILNLQSANPSASKGALDMSTYTLNMESASTTTGVGDVTGIVERTHVFAQNVEYSFGSQFTTFKFLDANTKPTYICVEISIGSVAGWASWTPDGKVKRLYKLSCSNNSSDAQTNIKMRYLLSELDATYNDESALIFWHQYDGGAPVEYGKASQNFDDHYLGVVGLTLGAVVTEDLDESQVTMAYAVSEKNTWKGESSLWGYTGNWTKGTVPVFTDDVLIPGGLSTYPSLEINAVASTLEIEEGASITANDYDITISGAGGAWLNSGTLNPGTGKVSFNHGVADELVTLAGTTSFYDVEIGENTVLEPVTGTVIKFAGEVFYNTGSIADWSVINNTVEWNGADQTILTPLGIGGRSGYYNLIISGSGTKTMSATNLTVNGDFEIAGTAEVTGGSEITLAGDFTVGADATFNTGAYDHTIGGDFDINGTFTATQNRITLNGTTTQSIFSNSPISFHQLSIDHNTVVQSYAEISVADELNLVKGNLNVGSGVLGINGTLIKSSGFLEVSPVSSISFGGTTTTLLTLPDNLFTDDPSIQNLVVDCSGGVALGNQNFTVNDSLILTEGTLYLVDNSINFAGLSPTRTTGAIDATDPASFVIFSNAVDPISLPASLFTGNISNLKITGIGGVVSVGDLTVDATLSLLADNPSSTIGSLDMNDGSGMKILNMGANATTSGIGDVTGIIKRTSFVANKDYTFGNQFATVNFNAGGTYPTCMAVTVSIGAAPVWKPGSIERIYDFVQTGGSDCYASVTTHYLESELNGNDENTLVQWTSDNPTTSPYDLHEWGRSSASTVDNWVRIINVDIADFPTTSGSLENTLSAPENTTYTWDGSESSDWTLLNNWTPSGSPSNVSNVIIPDVVNDPVIYAGSSVDCYDITVQDGATLTIKSTGISSTGSLIVHGEPLGDVNVERFLSKGTWHYISEPVNDTRVFDEFLGLTAGVNNDQFYWWDENGVSSGSTGIWFDILNNPTGISYTVNSFVSSQGYAISYSGTGDKTVSFEGVPYAANQSVAITKTDASGNPGANLIGNPFSSTIALNTSADEADNFLLDNDGLFDDTYGGVYLWDEKADYVGDRDDYFTVSLASASAFASPGQAFMVVKKDVGTSTVNFNTTIRNHGTATFYKRGSGDAPRLTLAIKDAENRANITTVAFLPNMTLGLDPAYDAGKLKGNSNIALYTRLIEDNGSDFAIQALPETDIENSIVPIGVDVVESVMCEFRIENETMEGYSIYLQDMKDNSMTNLREESYSTLVTESGTGRFFLHFKDASGVDESSNDKLWVWASNSVVTISNFENQVGDISIVNMFGQTIYKSKLTGDTNQQIDLNVPTGYYIVTVITSEGVFNQKLYL